MLLRTKHITVVNGEGLYLVSARSGVLSKLKSKSSRQQDEEEWREKVKRATKTTENIKNLRAPPVVPGTAGIDRKRYKTMEKQAEDKRRKVLEIKEAKEEARNIRWAVKRNRRPSGYLAPPRDEPIHGNVYDFDE